MRNYGQEKSKLRTRFQGALAERERIARELHDTFLQSVQELMLRFQVLSERISMDAPSRERIEEALDRANQVIAEGRDMILKLRTHSFADLPSALRTLGGDLAHDAGIGFEIGTDGELTVSPMVQEEVYRIGAEALVNAFRHGQAANITVRIAYARRGLLVRVVDDGCGFDLSVSRETFGRWGLRGMQERAATIRARLNIRSRIGEGTRVQLFVPASVAYSDSFTPPHACHFPTKCR
jgi:signal transduction histidine kinase